MYRNKFVVFPVLVFFICILGSCNYFNLKKENIKADVKLYLPTGCTYNQMLDSIHPLVIDFNSFEKAAQSKHLKKIYSGRYSFKKGASNKEIVEKLLLGKQDEISITIGNYNSVYELANKVAPILEITPEQIINAIASQPEAQGLDTLQMIYFLAPNTYRFFWTIKADDFAKKISKPFQDFWTDDRQKQLDSLGFTKMQAVTLASIVQSESYKIDEQPIVAGLYLNRLKIGMRLQADPTVIFTMKLKQGWDKKILRVYNKDLKIPSPYNTYLHSGLPPGPICMPNPSAINAVLHPQKNDYIYFVADPSRPGYHLYARTSEEQIANAKKYYDWLKQNNIQ